MDPEHPERHRLKWVEQALERSPSPPLNRSPRACCPLKGNQMTFSFLRTSFAAAAISLLTGHAAGAVDISGAGATFPFPVYAKWADAYKKETGNGLNYQSIGSGGGIKQIKAKTVTFGATDMPLEAAELAASGLVQFPTVIGGDVPVVNLEGIKPGELVLDGP